MTRNKIKKYLIGLFISIVAISLFIFSMQLWEEYRMEKKGNEVVNRVEAFRNEHGRLPDSLAEMGLPDDMGTQPFYIKRSGSNYEVYYALGFDSGYIYRSDTKKWADNP